MFKSYDVFFSFLKQEELYPDDPSVSQERRDIRQVNFASNSMISSVPAALGDVKYVPCVLSDAARSPNR